MRTILGILLAATVMAWLMVEIDRKYNAPIREKSEALRQEILHEEREWEEFKAKAQTTLNSLDPFEETCFVTIDLSEEYSGFDELIDAVIQVESGGDPAAQGNYGELGVLQIRPIMVREVNRIMAHVGQVEFGGTFEFYHDQMLDADTSKRVFVIYSQYWALHWNDYTCEGIARRWNGGPEGHVKQSTLGYWKKVQTELQD